MLECINERFFGVATPIALIVAGVYFGCRLKWFHILAPIRTARVALKGGGRSAFSALCLALAGTLGVGKIVGVAAAISLGGYGAVFWMCLSAFFAMILKYSEIVVAVGHRRHGEGSAMYYIEDRFSARGGIIGRFLAVIFASALAVNALTMGSMIQSGAAAEAFERIFYIPRPIVSVGLSAVALCVFGFGKAGVMRVTERIVPFMTVIFSVMSLIAIVMRCEKLPEAFRLIFRDAFSPHAAAGGIFGFVGSTGIRYGVMRGLISNEAGCGTSPMAHSESESKDPAISGVWGIFEVFIDTVVLCTMTALVIILSEVPLNGNGFMFITASAYSAILGEWAGMFMAVAALFFAFATVICWWSYGRAGVIYIFRKRRAALLFSVLYVVAIALGGVISSDLAWQAADTSIGVMTIINVAALVLMRREILERSSFLMRRY